ncbi:hypothetical protein [Jeotgalibaca porci]|uniref:ATPase, T2SS/T4P/T4SS family n=1 Tax=Jeotgalibaca porci TaxID=1868793 RepID=UPI00359FDEEA
MRIQEKQRRSRKRFFERRGQTIETITNGEGCDACRQTGYRGRMAIHELLVVDESMKKLMMNNASFQELKNHMIEKNTRLLIDDGLLKVKAGKTTLEEILRVASLDD